EKAQGNGSPQAAGDRESKLCDTLFVSEENFLGDPVEAVAYRQLAGALAGLGPRCEVICRFVIPGEEEADVDRWLSARKWAPDAAPAGGEAEGGAAVLKVTTHGVPMTLLRGSSTKPHNPDDAERAAFLGVVSAALDRRRPDVVVATPGACLADVLAA